MFKIIGCCMIVLSCGMGGIHLSSRLKEEVELIRILLKFFRHIREQLTFGGAPVREIFRTASEDDRFEKLDFIRLCYTYMEDTSFADSFADAIANCNCLKGRNKSLITLVGEFGKQFGSAITPVELEKMELLTARLQDLLEEAQEKYTKNAKMYNTLGIMSGLALAIILW